VVIGQGDTFDEALADTKSALKCHLEEVGTEALDADSPVLEAFIVDTAPAR
jgi:predicted RNase H-like HicB family nuclease